MLIASLLFIENHCNYLLINKEIIINKSMWLDHICPNEHMCALSRHPLMFIALVLSIFSLSACDHLDCCYHFIQPLFAIVICAYHILDLQYCYWAYLLIKSHLSSSSVLSFMCNMAFPCCFLLIYLNITIFLVKLLYIVFMWYI